MSNECRVEAISIYPVKSLKGISVSEAVLTTKGFQYDRHWMIVNPKGHFLTQRQCARMALIHTELNSETLRLSNPETETPLDISLLNHQYSEPLNGRIWKNDVNIVDAGDTASRWLTDVLKTPWPVRLVKMADGFERIVDQSDKLSSGNTEVTTEFADGYPYLIANQASLDAVNQKLDSPIKMNRFRPNIVISGLSAFEEHNVEAIMSDGIEFSLRYPCERCVITTIDQSTAIASESRSPLKELIEINPMPNKSAAAFGENAELIAGIGKKLRVGDVFKIKE
ncbi:MOSC domain-containing protein [Pleionea sediminis]|uniref:MOSC domain-containing protein n=1 Tax=Pleionea sediminis TaxID=2569479 RepID=UPI001186E48D|nr:MOSC N-terminal beta barrel domain-containing protein [Pleionea sediminis]